MGRELLMLLQVTVASAIQEVIESFFDEWVARGEEMEAGSELQCLSAILGLFQLKSTHFNSHLTRTVDRLSLPGRAYTCTSLIQSSCHSQGVPSSVPESSHH